MKLIVIGVTSRKKRYSVVPVSREYYCGFLTAEVVPIIACSLGKLMTSNNGTTSAEEIPTIIFESGTFHNRVPFLSGMEYTSNHK